MHEQMSSTICPLATHAVTSGGYPLEAYRNPTTPTWLRVVACRLGATTQGLLGRGALVATTKDPAPSKPPCPGAQPVSPLTWVNQEWHAIHDNMPAQTQAAIPVTSRHMLPTYSAACSQLVRYLISTAHVV
jgi:hypothetical protein